MFCFEFTDELSNNDFIRRVNLKAKFFLGNALERIVYILTFVHSQTRQGPNVFVRCNFSPYKNNTLFSVFDNDVKCRDCHILQNLFKNLSRREFHVLCH